jgi:hypothetical protein
MGAVASAQLSLLAVIEPQNVPGIAVHAQLSKSASPHSDIPPLAAGYVHAQVLHGPR